MLKEAKKLLNVFKSNLNEISRGEYQSVEQKGALENIKLLYNSGEAIAKLYNEYSSIASEAIQQYKAIHGKGHPGM